MRLSICEFTTLGASFEEDLAAYRAAGVEGIGVCELKVGEGAAERLRESGLRATHCVPAVPSILPLPLMEGPAEPEERVAALCASAARFAELEPICVLFLTGPAGGRDDARAVVRGWYDVRIFSDNGAFGDAFPDSLWDLDPYELAPARESVSGRRADGLSGHVWGHSPDMSARRQSRDGLRAADARGRWPFRTRLGAVPGRGRVRR